MPETSKPLKVLLEEIRAMSDDNREKALKEAFETIFSIGQEYKSAFRIIVRSMLTCDEQKQLRDILNENDDLILLEYLEDLHYGHRMH